MLLVLHLKMKVPLGCALGKAQIRVLCVQKIYSLQSLFSSNKIRNSRSRPFGEAVGSTLGVLVCLFDSSLQPISPLEGAKWAKRLHKFAIVAYARLLIYYSLRRSRLASFGS